MTVQWPNLLMTGAGLVAVVGVFVFVILKKAAGDAPKVLIEQLAQCR